MVVGEPHVTVTPSFLIGRGRGGGCWVGYDVTLLTGSLMGGILSQDACIGADADTMSQVGGRAGWRGGGGTQAGLQPTGFLARQPCTSGTGAGGQRRSRVSDSSTDKRAPTGGPVPPRPSLQPPQPQNGEEAGVYM